MSTSNCNHATCQGETCRREKKVPKPRTPINRTALKRSSKPLKRTAPINRHNSKPKAKDDELEQFFYDCACIIAKHPYCSECFEWIPPNLYRFATAHIFAKKQFPSIKTHPLNWLILGSTCGCHDKSHRMDTFSKMKVFPIAVQKFRQFEHLISENHKLLDTFKQYADEICQKKN